MKITRITSHILGYDLPEPLGYSQQYYTKRTAHLVEVETDEGITGWGECFGAGNIALANKGIVEQVIQPMVLGMDPLDRDVIWHKIYNLMRDHGQKGMPLQSLSGVDIALWDIAGKVAGLPLHKDDRRRASRPHRRLRLWHDAAPRKRRQPHVRALGMRRPL